MDHNNVLTREERRSWLQTIRAGQQFATSAIKNTLKGGKRDFTSPNDLSLPQPQRNVAKTRDESLQQLLEAADKATPLDVLVVGGGATGTGIALDLVARSTLAVQQKRSTPLRVGLVEANDFASETSSRSSKLIHGGVRYLEKAVFGCDFQQLKLVFEALSERAIVVNQAPFLVHPIETIIPCYSFYDVVMFWVGMKMYDFLAVLGGGVVGGFSHFQFKQGTRKMYSHLSSKRYADAPKLFKENVKPKCSGSNCLLGMVGSIFWRSVALAVKAVNFLVAFPSFLIGSVCYYDGQHHDARLCLHVAMTATTFGASCVNHCRLLTLETVEDETKTETGTLRKCTLLDSVSGQTHIVYAKAIVNATGPFSDTIRRIVNPQHTNKVKPSHGTHLTLPQSYAPKDRAMLIPSNDGRVIFCISYMGHCIAGTTDAISAIEESPQAPEKDVEFILDNLRIHLGSIKRSEVLSVWCGIRPLASPETVSTNSSSQSIVREHNIFVDEKNKMLSITGGKWTTFRKMASDAVTALVDSGLVDLPCEDSDSITSEMVLFGTRKLSLYTSSPASMHHAPSHFSKPYWNACLRLSAMYKVPAVVVLNWIQLYGDRVEVLCEMAAEVMKGEGELEGSEQYWREHRYLCPSDPSIVATDIDVIYSTRFESCERVQDFIARRSPMAFLNAMATRDDALPIVANLMATEKNWSEQKKMEEIENAKAYMKTFEAKV